MNPFAPLMGMASSRRKAIRSTATSSTEHDEEWAKYRADPAKFIDELCIIDETQGDTITGTVPFKLWDDQKAVVGTLAAEDRVIILKARQLGISWLVCGYVLHLCVFHPGKRVILLSQGEEEADELTRRVAVMYERLPEWIRLKSPLVKQPQTSKIVWANGSRVQSFAATKRKGRSFTASLLVMDECAHMQFAKHLYTAAKPTIDAVGGRLVILSSANGFGNLFHDLWQKAEAKLNEFAAVFLPWWSRPGRDAAWYAKVKAESTDPALVKQEYPANPREAFVASGRLRFPSDWIDAQEPNLQATGIPPEVLPEAIRSIPGLTVYKLPTGRRAVIGADVAEGLEHGDFSTATVLDWDSHEELATIHGHWEPDEYAGYLDTLARWYEAQLVVERNNHGHATLVTLKALECPHVANGPDDRPGWLSNLKTKPESIDALAEELRDGACTVRTPAALTEMRQYTVVKKGKTSAPEGGYDDRVMAWAIAIAYSRMCLPAPPAVSAGPAMVLAPRPSFAPLAPPTIPGMSPLTR